MITRVCYISNTGKVRRNNEDSMLLNDLLVSEADLELVECLSPRKERQIYVVADGMGGHQRGEVASKAVLKVFRESYRHIENGGDVREVIGLAKRELNRIARRERTSYGLGTTVAGLVLIGDRVLVVNCGDSRVYREKGERIERITKDHSFVQELVDAGILSEEEMRSHPQKNIITSAVTGDLRDELPEMEIEEIPVEKGQRFLLCSDGVWESMSHDEMTRCFAERETEGVVDRLFRKVIDSGARDNLSIIVLEILADAEKRYQDKKS